MIGRRGFITGLVAVAVFALVSIVSTTIWNYGFAAGVNWASQQVYPR